MFLALREFSLWYTCRVLLYVLHFVPLFPVEQIGKEEVGPCDTSFFDMLLNAVMVLSKIVMNVIF